MFNQAEKKREKIIKEKSVNEQIKFYKTRFVLMLISVIIAVPLYIGFAVLILKWNPVPNEYWIPATSLLIFLAVLFPFGIKELVRYKRILKDLNKQQHK